MIRICVVVLVLMALLDAPRSRAADCNANGVEDATDIATGTSRDCNANNVPDECDLQPRVGLEPGISFPVGAGSSALILRDFDNDGALDVVTTNTRSWTVSVAFNDGLSVFRRALSFRVKRYPDLVTAGDFDADGDVDLAVAYRQSDRVVSILMNDGAGVFECRATIPISAFPRSLVAADLDGDGDLDLVLPDGRATTASILLNLGAGVFGEPVRYAAGGDGRAPSTLQVGDLNGDGFPDLIVGSRFTDRVWIVRNQGDGTFSLPIGIDLGEHPGVWTLADVDGDGRLDFVVATGGDFRDPQQITVFLKRGDRYFVPGPESAISVTANTLVAADFDGDGDMDLALTARLVDRLLILLNDGAGAFTETVIVPAKGVLGGGGATLATGDLDGDGRVDLALSNGTIFLNRRLPVSADCNDNGVPDTCDIAEHTSDDCNGNAVPDECEPDCNGNGVADACDLSDGLSEDCDLNRIPDECDADCNGNGVPDACDLRPLIAFVPERRDAEDDSEHDVLAVDLNNDGHPDLVLTHDTGEVAIRLNQGDGTFGAPAEVHKGSGPAVVTAADVDGDGLVDLVAVHAYADTIVLLRNLGNATFVTHVVLQEPELPARVTIGDFDADGNLDLATANAGRPPAAGVIPEGGVTVFLNQGDAVFAPAVHYEAGRQPRFITSADLDGDFDLDLVVVNWSSDDISILLNNGDGTFVRDANLMVGPLPRFAACADLDADGDLDLLVFRHGSVSVLFNDGHARFASSTVEVGRSLADEPIVGDFDADGDLDLLVPSYGPFRYCRTGCSHPQPVFLYALLNGGDGTFSPPVRLPIAALGRLSVAAGDLNGDGALDVVAAGGTDVRILWNATASPISRDRNGNSILDECERMGDFDADGDLDLGDYLALQWCFAGPGGPLPDDPICLEADLDFDGDVDLADLITFQANFTGAR